MRRTPRHTQLRAALRWADSRRGGGLTRELARRGHDVTVATTNVDGPGELDVPLSRPVPTDGVDVWYFPIQRPRWYHFSAPMGRALRDLVRRSDVVHIHSVFLWPTTIAAFWCRRLRRPVRGARGWLSRPCLARQAIRGSASVGGQQDQEVDLSQHAWQTSTWAARRRSTSPPRSSWSRPAACASQMGRLIPLGCRLTPASRGR